MRILLLTENPVLALGREAALRQAGHTLLLCSTVAHFEEGRVRWLSKGDAVGQAHFVASLFGITA